jgi:CHASE2 domain-containing sensor protein
MDGVELAAQVAENELSGRPVRVVSHRAHVLADFGLGVLLLFLLPRLSPPGRFLLQIGTVAFAILASLLLFRTSTYFFSFVPVLAGLRIHESIEQFLERRHLEHENLELKKRIAELNVPREWIDPQREIATPPREPGPKQDPGA